MMILKVGESKSIVRDFLLSRQVDYIRHIAHVMMNTRHE